MESSEAQGGDGSRIIAYVLDRKNGDSHTGFIQSRTPDELVLKDATASEIKVPSNDIAKLTPQKLSLMPEGLLQNLTAQEAADLLEFLTTLR